MENKDALNSQMRGYIVDKQTKLSGKGQDEFVEKTSREFNQIRKSTDRTTRFRNELEMAKSLKAPTVHIIDDWVDDVEYYADKMHDFDKKANRKVFGLPGNFATNSKTQEQYENTLYDIVELYQERLEGVTQKMNSVEKADYMRDITADRDFILSYFEYEKYQERERNHDDGDTPTEELAPKKKPEKEEHIEYANTADKSLRIPREKSMEGVLARVSEKQKNEQTKNREKTHQKTQKGGRGWPPGNR